MNSPLRSFVRRGKTPIGLVAVAAVGAGLVFSGCSSVSASANARSFGQSLPPCSVVPDGTALNAAEVEARRHEGDFVLVGTGLSMLPRYQPGTALVVHPTSYFMLKPGMPVVYVNRRGARVAHLLAEKSESGWVAIGLNNPKPDDDFVTAENLIGVVKAAFVANDSVGRDGRHSIVAMLTGGVSQTNLLH